MFVLFAHPEKAGQLYNFMSLEKRYQESSVYTPSSNELESIGTISRKNAAEHFMPAVQGER